MAMYGGSRAAIRSTFHGDVVLTVFQVRADVEGAQWLSSDEFEQGRLTARPANGESIATRPWPRSLHVLEASIKRTDFFMLNEFFLTMDGRTRKLCEAALNSCGEFIRFQLRETGEDIFLFNTWLTLEPEAVDWVATKPSFGVHYNLTLKAERIKGPSIFRIPKMAALFVATHLQPDDADFYHLYQKHELTGLYFKRLWDERSGGVSDRSTGRRIDD